MFSPTDTIVAIATPPGRGGIGVVRISGPAAGDIAARILTSTEPLVPRTARFTRIVATRRDEEHGERTETRAIDQVVATYFPAPASYTGEDVLEISAHGSPVVLQSIVRSAIDAGARLAEPGEFTLRAFVNGRIDLIQAEAVADLVDAVTPLQARAAFDQLEGTLTARIGAIDRAVFDLIAGLEASVDFPDEGYHFVTAAELAAALERLCADIDALAREGGRGRLVREGRQVVIAGKPNVGKSTLFNCLLGADRAIVTSVAGTTRDLVTETADLHGMRICLVDTAGVREPGDPIEREGVARAVGAASVADLVVVVLDRSRPLDADDRALLQSAEKRERLIAVNKCDLPAAWTTESVDALCAGVAAGAGGARAVLVEISLRRGDGVTDLKHKIAERLSGADPLRDVPAVTNMRHVALLEKAEAAVRRARGALTSTPDGVPEEFLLADLQEARAALEEITGRRTTEDLLKHIFGRFCVGK